MDTTTRRPGKSFTLSETEQTFLKGKIVPYLFLYLPRFCLESFDFLDLFCDIYSLKMLFDDGICGDAIVDITTDQKNVATSVLDSLL